MYSSNRLPRSVRRGIVLVLVLGMLALMALIGVTFAVFAGQSLINGRNFMQGVGRPNPESLMDFALAQLINDTKSPVSALRGHSLLRDMYGNDSVFRGRNPTLNNVSKTGGVVSILQDLSDAVPNGPTPLRLTAYGPFHSTTDVTPFYNQLQYQTNIPATGDLANLDFTRWTIRFLSNARYDSNKNLISAGVPQSYEVLEDIADTGGTGFHLFTLSANLANPTQDPTFDLGTAPMSSSDWTTFVNSDPNMGAIVDTDAKTITKSFSSLATELDTTYPGSRYGQLGGSNGALSTPFYLDGRYMRAFNGPGMTRPDVSNTGVYPYNIAALANFRVSGLDPDTVGMDEDYDACDLENWYLAIQSADGQVVIPSFHRPGILMGSDWDATATASSRSKILRPRQADNSPLFPADPRNPDPTTGKLTYDVDNDGDGVTDSVWLDLGYPVQRDTGGRLYKPLFAFMVLGLNGRLPLNTVGNLQARAIGDTANNAAVGAVASTGQVPYPGEYTANPPLYQTPLTSQTFQDAPLWDHASHLGYSVNEINPKFALQNAPSNVYASVDGAVAANAFGGYPTYDNTNPVPNHATSSYAQYDNVGVSVALTQLRNILAGTIPTSVTNPVVLGDQTNVLASSDPTLTPNNDRNIAVVDGQFHIFPNNVADRADLILNNSNVVERFLPPVPGRFGEAEGVPRVMPTVASHPIYGAKDSSGNPYLKYPNYFYNNQVRAGFSVNTYGPNDLMDDDLDGTDPPLANREPIKNQNYSALFTIVQDVDDVAGDTRYGLPLNDPAYTLAPPRTFSRQYLDTTTNTPLRPEFADVFDIAGQMAFPVERSRRFVTPQDPAGTGRVVSYMARPKNGNDFGTGYDDRGRTGFFRYFRAPGMPQEIRYPYSNQNGYTFLNYPYASASPLGQQFLMPVLVPAGYSTNTADPSSRSDGYNTPTTTFHRGNNKLNGYQSKLTPAIAGSANDQTIASMGAMPFDWDPTADSYAGDVPAGYANATPTPPVTPPIPRWNNLVAPMINPYISTGQGPNNVRSGYNLRPGSILPTSISNSNGPNLGATGKGAAYPIPYADYADSPSTNQPYSGAGLPGAQVVNGYIGGSLNKDEADEMNLYTVNRADMPYGPSDLEWLYRKHDVDGATLNSRLSKLAPISFLNPADGQTRRRLFSTDVWDLNTFAYANDNPVPYAGVLGRTPNTAGYYSTDHDFRYNSRFTPSASPSLEGMNQVPSLDMTGSTNHYANYITTEFLPNPTLPPQSAAGNNIHSYHPNSSYPPVGTNTPIVLPLQIDPNNPNSPLVSYYDGTIARGYETFQTSGFTNAHVDQYTGLIVPSGTLSSVQVQTPSVAHRDRKINLNFPLPISNDPAEPVRQKWCRETYQMLKAILPPASVDTPEELAALSQFVVNIVDFRDTDCTTTRFVNTDLEVTDVLTHSTNPVVGDAAHNSTFNVSPLGVKFATAGIAGGHFPYDPTLYNPDHVETPPDLPAGTNPAKTTFLVQHGMEYNPIAINEAIAYQSYYGASTGVANPYHAMFIELVNTLSPEQNNNAAGTTPLNASTISLAGWDLIIAPDNYGWGRPDAISGELNPIAYPPSVSGPTGPMRPTPPPPMPAGAAATDLAQVQRFEFTSANRIPVTPTGTTPRFILGGYYNVPGGTNPSDLEITPTLATTPDVSLPTTFVPAPPASPGAPRNARYYWLYLRRPANPFDDQPLNATHLNREMVVVDAMRFPYINATPPVMNAPPNDSVRTVSPNTIYSAQRLQPYRGGHLLPNNTTAPGAAPDAASPAAGVATICPPSPPQAYGYSEQTRPPASGTTTGRYLPSSGAAQATTLQIRHTINSENNPKDDQWSHLPFHDRDFSNVMELLMVPGCPPGLFTKQFVEEPYPGNNTGLGLDDSSFATTIVPPVAPNIGRTNFATTGTNPPEPTFPYLSDNFYYTAASVAPPSPGTGSLDAGYTRLTTEIGGWTGAGWHKMLEFFEVPSSANGAIGSAANGNNYDWARADIKPGQLNLNLIIDEEVFAGLIDDPRLNESLAGLTSAIPYVVSQIDANGYPAQDGNGVIVGRSPIYGLPSYNLGTNGGPLLPVPYPVNNANDTLPQPPYFNPNWGRGYVVREADAANYVPASLPTPDYQQVHGLKAAFSDFLKLRHGGSGYLFGFGAGPVGSGDFVTGPLTPPLATPTLPLAAERPYRSLSYPDINYTILRPASLPPSPIDPDTTTFPNYGNSSPPLPSGTDLTLDPGNLTGLFQYGQSVAPTAPTPNPYVSLSTILAPMNQNLLTPTPGTDFPYVQDPGIKNPFLPIQFVNRTSPLNNPAGSRPLGPPYAVHPPTKDAIPAAPFPPPIPPIPGRRLFQIPDVTSTGTAHTSNASLLGQVNNAVHTTVNGKISTDTSPTPNELATEYQVNKPTVTLQLSTPPRATAAPLSSLNLDPTVAGTIVAPYPPTLFDQARKVFGPDNFAPQAAGAANNFLGGSPAGSTKDYRQHPLYRTELIQKIANLTTVRTHQYAVWITVGFFEVVRPGTPELGVTDVLSQEVGAAGGRSVRYRSFFVIDRTRATGFNPYNPGNFRDCVTYRRRIE